MLKGQTQRHLLARRLDQRTLNGFGLLSGEGVGDHLVVASVAAVGQPTWAEAMLSGVGFSLLQVEARL